MIGFAEQNLCLFMCQNSEWKDDFVFCIAEIES